MSVLTNEQIFRAVSPHSEGCEFPEIDCYRAIVEESVFDRTAPA
jgi:hypothetical protein